jgi:TrpR-related protein YerC/YecD
MPKRTFTEGGWRRDKRFQALCRALLACRTEREVADFLRDVGTLSELFAWSERWDVAQRLGMGQTYREAAVATGTSTTTITRVASFLFDGEGGYQRVLRSQHHRHPRASRAERMVSITC